MKFKLLVSLAIGWFAMGAQAAVVADVGLSSLAATRSSGDTFAAQAERSRVDSVASSAEDSVALPEPDLALLIAGVGVVGFLAARRRNR